MCCLVKKNAKDKILVMYAEDGSDRTGCDCHESQFRMIQKRTRCFLLGVESAFLMFQKNFENVFLLTGGIKGFCEKYWGLAFGEIAYG